MIRLRKHLLASDPPPTWPSGIHLAPIAAVDPDELHALLAHSYADGAGTVLPREQWWPAMVADTEYDPGLVFVATSQHGQPIGLALCWNSAFVKDVAVDATWRGRGIGEALLRTAFAAFSRRGFTQVDLKVVDGNEPAIRLYRRVGMIEAALEG